MESSSLPNNRKKMLHSMFPERQRWGSVLRSRGAGKWRMLTATNIEIGKKKKIIIIMLAWQTTNPCGYVMAFWHQGTGVNIKGHGSLYFIGNKLDVRSYFKWYAFKHMLHQGVDSIIFFKRWTSKFKQFPSGKHLDYQGAVGCKAWLVETNDW